MTALRAFFSMGGYAAYVWPAFATAAVVMAGLLVASRRRWRANAALLQALEGQRPRRRRAGPAAQKAAGAQKTAGAFEP